jgi:hypothetical protein
MAAVPVTITGATLTGVLSWSGLEIGGGPMPGGPSVMPPIYYPPAGGGQPPLGIWGGAPIPWPTPPIYYPPTQPPGIWPSPGVPTHPIYNPPPVGIWPSPGVPTHPIVLPPGEPPAGGPPADGKWAWSPIYGWVWLPSGGGDKPHPPEGTAPTPTPPA